jgi:hypothetical protein
MFPCIILVDVVGNEECPKNKVRMSFRSLFIKLSGCLENLVRLTVRLTQCSLPLRLEHSSSAWISTQNFDDENRYQSIRYFSSSFSVFIRQ